MNTIEDFEKKLNIATSLIDELSLNTDIVPININSPVVFNDESNDNFEVFTLQSLQKDFIIIRQNVMKLISSGQRILDTVSLLDVSDLKASQITAISMLLKTISDNSKSLFEIYHQIVEIEKMRLKEKPVEQSTSMINSGTVVNNQILFNGDTTQLLDFIKQNQSKT